MRVLRDVADDRRDVELELVVQRHDLTQHVRAAEVLDGGHFRQQHTGRVVQGRGVTVQVVEVENLQYFRVGEAQLLVEALRTHGDQHLAAEGAGHGFHVGNLGRHDRPHSREG